MHERTLLKARVARLHDCFYSVLQRMQLLTVTADLCYVSRRNIEKT